MKKRLDVLLTERGIAPSREKAKALIMSGDIYVNGQKAEKAGEEFDESCEIEAAASLRYVSRGGLKLEKTMQKYNISLADKVCADIGASTGGFTDCMLQSGAARVYAVDVGYGQLAWKLRQDERVVCLERTNARYLTEEQIPDRLNFFSMDVSFISVRLILPAVTALLAEGGEGAILIKPQFEAGRGKVGKNGVVRERATHVEVVKLITDFLLELGYGIIGLDYSPIKGPKGNIEFLAYVKYGAESLPYDVDAVVDAAHKQLKEEA
ncbi:MAG: TlyA family RNA methyltransferase [Oscillospiraceae bacterium]|nr:TlyA family RNA methyltransferase [Oscillospiraceae bacterium]